MVTHGSSVRPNSISCRDAIRELHQRVKAAVPDPDPAPWLDISPVLIEMFSEGDEVAFVRRKKMEERSMLVMQRGLLSGALCAHFSDELESRDVPGWAWVGAERNEHVWFEGRLPLDVFLPHEWQRWSCHPVYLDRDAFTEWMDNQPLHDSADLPALPSPFDAQSKPEPVKKRLPPDAPFVSLSEALTWIAFGIALDRDGLYRAFSGHAFEATNPEAALSAAMARLAVEASGGEIAMRGKYVESHSTDENSVFTAPIDPVRFEDFAQFDILYDGLRYGMGLTWTKEGSAFERMLQDRRDAFRSVKVNRADLLRLFPDQNDPTRAFFVPLPAALPDIGPVMALEEALSWLAYGKPSHDPGLWHSAAGDLIIRDPSGAIIEPSADGTPPPFIEAYRQASRTIHVALREGSMPVYVAPTSGIPLLVPRFYWNSVDPESLHHVYRGMTHGDDGAGCPMLLSRKEFNLWRQAASSSVERVFTRNDMVVTNSWWNTLQALAWVATRTVSYVEHIAERGNETPNSSRLSLAYAMAEGEIAGRLASARVDEVVDLPSWEGATIFARAGRLLLDQIREGNIRPVARALPHNRRLELHDFAAVGMSPAAADWSGLSPQPLFSSSELMAVIPQRPAESGEDETLPEDEVIREKMLELMGAGIGRDQAAIHIRSIKGFKAVGNEHARRTVAGYATRGRPKKARNK